MDMSSFISDLKDKRNIKKGIRIIGKNMCYTCGKIKSIIAQNLTKLVSKNIVIAMFKNIHLMKFFKL